MKITGSKALFVFFISFLLVASPSGYSESTKRTTDPGYWNNLARFLAGMSVEKNSPLYQFTGTGYYKEHVRNMDKFWAMVKRETIDKVIPWQQENIETIEGRSTVFYPLSGADFINPCILYPNSHNYILAALEKSGKIPDLLKLNGRKLREGLLSIQRSLFLYGRNNYFQTKIMIREFRGYSIRGTIPVMMVFLARMGFQTIKVEKILINEKGDIEISEPDKIRREKRGKTRGVMILFKVPGDPSLRSLTYLEMKLDGVSVSPKTPSGKFLSRLNNLNTLIKAGCYILHLKKFAPVKDYILRKSRMIIQDDSGIPNRFFGSDTWEIKYFGVYRPVYPISDTKVYKQRDLLKVYRSIKNPLPFNFGYGSLLGKNNSNLMVATKKGDEASR